LGRARKRSWSIGHITHGAKQTGERRTGNPSAPFDFAIPWGWITAASVVVTVPLIVLVLLFQRRIISGLTAGAIR